MKLFIALHVTKLPLIQQPFMSRTYTTMVILKRNCKDVDINVRHSVSLTGNDRYKMRFLKEILTNLLALHEEFVANNDLMSDRMVLRYAQIIFAGYDSISTVEIDHPINYVGDRLRFDVLDIGMIATTYRFKNISQLRELKDCLQIPDRMVNPHDRSAYDGEELLLLVLERCALGTRLVDLQNKYHRNHSAIGKAINYFCSWLQQHWGYLIHDHLDFWKPYLRGSRDAIVAKLQDYYRDLEVEIDVDLRVASFIDCTIIGTSRPGGGPMEAGPNAERFPGHVQRAFYNKWARKHGIKKQSCCLSNGMALHIGTGFSCRRHDLHLLRESNLNEMLTNLYVGDNPEDHYQIYGDSAYIIMQNITCAADIDQFGDIRAGMNACRESIEWMYRDLKIMWAITSTKYKLKLLNEFTQVDNVIDACFIFNNAWNCMNGNETSQWFRTPPPSFATYTELGPN